MCCCYRSKTADPPSTYGKRQCLGQIAFQKLRLEMAQDNIESRPLWKPMHLQPVFEDATYYGAKVVADLFEKGLCLPSGSNLTDEDRERIASSIQKLLSIK